MIGRTLADLIFAELPTTRRREVISAVAHYIAGVLDKDSMSEIILSLCSTAQWKAGDRVKTLRGTIQGTITEVLGDGRIVWTPDGRSSPLIALPESLVLAGKQPKPSA